MPKEIPIKNAAIITLVILIVLMLISGLRYGEVMKNATAITVENELSKNVELAIGPGDVFMYSFGPNETTDIGNVTFYVEDGGNCTLIFIGGAPPTVNLCLDEWGNDESGLNESFTVEEVFFFRPWMLALREGWSWETTTYIRIGNYLNEVYRKRYRVMRTELYENRTAFVVEVSEDGVPYEYLWIDYEKRILLKVKGETYHLKLVSGIE